MKKVVAVGIGLIILFCVGIYFFSPERVFKNGPVG
jgi:hypothetical protein